MQSSPKPSQFPVPLSPSNTHTPNPEDQTRGQLQGRIETVAVSDLFPNPRNARTQSNKLITQIATSIDTFGFNNPILVGIDNDVIAGHGRSQAGKQLGLKTVPVVRLDHLSDAEKSAYILADNKIALNAGWDSELLTIKLGELTDLLPKFDLDIKVTGFEMGKIDLVLSDFEEPSASNAKEDKLLTLLSLSAVIFGSLARIACSVVTLASPKQFSFYLIVRLRVWSSPTHPTM